MTPFFLFAARSANFGSVAPPTKIILVRPPTKISAFDIPMLFTAARRSISACYRHLGMKNDSDRLLECSIISSGFCYFRAKTTN